MENLPNEALEGHSFTEARAEALAENATRGTEGVHGDFHEDGAVFRVQSVCWCALFTFLTLTFHGRFEKRT